LAAEEVSGQAEQAEKKRCVEEDAQEPHHRELRERVEQPAAGSLHVLAAEADELGAGVELPQCPQEVRAVQVAAGFAGAEEEGELPAVVHFPNLLCWDGQRLTGSGKRRQGRFWRTSSPPSPPTGARGEMRRINPC